MSERKQVSSGFPRLKSANSFTVTSPITPQYNCIAWAAGDTKRWWWPHGDEYWPIGVPKEVTANAFVKAFETLGYEIANSAVLEEGKQKVAIFAKNGSPTHAARQLVDGQWASKLGDKWDILHASAQGVGGECYGEIVHYLVRARIQVDPDPSA